MREIHNEPPVFLSFPIINNTGFYYNQNRHPFWETKKNRRPAEYAGQQPFYHFYMIQSMIY